jgi:glycosyltransferase involved in cell wall biosynthesis
MKIGIVCDGFNIGGIQRLALDQAYSLNSKGYKTVLLVLNEKPTNLQPTFLYSEAHIISRSLVEIIFIPGNKFQQFVRLFFIFKKTDFRNIISHSLRGSVLLYAYRIIFRKKFYLSTTLHQLPSLSSPSQHFKRVIYSQFTDELFCFSIAAQAEWINRMKFSKLLKILGSHKKPVHCRNGVFLPRLDECKQPNSLNSAINSGVRRLVFIGRLTEWKGFEKFIEIAFLQKLEHLRILIVTPTNPGKLIKITDKSFLERIKIEVGKSIHQIPFEKGDIHLYPANYGDQKDYVEGVSINVLEMACLGIPSLITQNGNKTWPELSDLGVVFEVNWEKPIEVSSVILTQVRTLDPSKIAVVKKIVNIDNNIDKLTKLWN